MRARLADGDGALGVAAASYGEALAQDPASLEIARRAYFQALESGDMALALRSAVLLDARGLLPRDGTLLLLCDAIIRKDWSTAHQWADRLTQEANFAFLVPIVRSWIAMGEGRTVPPVIDAGERFAPLARRYLDEHLVLQMVGQGRVDEADAHVGPALAVRTADISGIRLTFAAQLAARGARDRALLLLPAGEANFAAARADIMRRRKIASMLAAPIGPRQAYARLLSRLATDVSSESNGLVLGLRLARIATFADPDSAEGHIVAARLLTRAGHGAYARTEAAKVPEKGWFGALGQAELVDAMAADGDLPAAIALARTLAQARDAEADRHIRLGRLLLQAGDYSDAAAAFSQARSRYPADAVPWTLLLLEGSALEQGDLWAEARTVLERAARQAPDEPVVLNYLGYAQIERRQNVQAALALLERASALSPQDPSITDSLGWAQFIAGNVDKAVPILERAAAGAPADVTINEHLGDALWAAGRRYEARYAWHAASLFAEGEAADRIAAKTREGMRPEYAAP
ncbi:MAG: tetratricopeptide repeat protein [Sphingobium sp.]